MVAGKDLGLPPEVKATGWRPGKKKGWIGLAKSQYVACQASGSRKLSIAYVLYNDKNGMSIEAQSCRMNKQCLLGSHLQAPTRWHHSNSIADSFPLLLLRASIPLPQILANSDDLEGNRTPPAKLLLALRSVHPPKSLPVGLMHVL